MHDIWKSRTMIVQVIKLFHFHLNNHKLATSNITFKSYLKYDRALCVFLKKKFFHLFAGNLSIVNSLSHCKLNPSGRSYSHNPFMCVSKLVYHAMIQLF